MQLGGHSALTTFAALILVSVIYSKLLTTFYSCEPHSFMTARYPGSFRAVESDTPYIVPSLSVLKACRGLSCLASNPHFRSSNSLLNRTYIQQAPRAVMVLPLDASQSRARLSLMLKQRLDYCKRHDFGLFACFVQELDDPQDINARGDPRGAYAAGHSTFAPLQLLLHAMQFTFPRASVFWLYESSGHIRDPSVEPLILDLPTLGAEMLSNLTQPRVTLSNFAEKPEDSEIVLAYDRDTGLISSKSIAIKKTLSAIAFLQLALDPLLRSWQPYHTTPDHAGTALTHLLRWHPYFLATVALVSSEPGGVLQCSDISEKAQYCLQPRGPLLTDGSGHSGLDPADDVMLTHAG